MRSTSARGTKQPSSPPLARADGDYLQWVTRGLPGLMGLFRNVTMPLNHALVDIEETGVHIRRDVLEQLDADYREHIKRLELKFWDAAGEAVDYRSPASIQEFFERVLGLTDSKPTSTRYLRSQEEKHSAIKPLIELRQAVDIKQKFLAGWDGTYGLLPWIWNDGRIHTTYAVDGTKTGRLTSTNPNLHTIPRKGPVRSIFGGEGDNVFIECDYSQLELRIVALLADDSRLQEAFAIGSDIHRHVAAVIFDCVEDEVRPPERKIAKAVNFGVLYGMGPRALASKAGIEWDEAEDFLARWKAAFPRIANWLRKNKVRAMKRGYVDSKLGRRLHVPELSGETGDRKKLLRQANNFLVQSVGADLLSLSTIRLVCHPSREFQATGARVVMSLHDALFFECPRDSALDAARIVKETMEAIPRLILGDAWHLPVDVKVGEHWGDDSVSAPALDAG